MGPIHPRDKKPVGDRLATAAVSIAYGMQGSYTGPTLAGCHVADGKITVQFNRCSSKVFEGTGPYKLVARLQSRFLSHAKVC